MFHLRHPLLSVLVPWAVLAALANGADRYWDGTDSTSDADGGSGNWNLSDLSWDTAAAGGSDVAFAGNDRAIFGGVAGTVTFNGFLGGLNPVGSMHFTTGGYTLHLGAGFNARIAGGITSDGVAGPLFTLTGSSSFFLAVAGTSAAIGQTVGVQSGSLQVEYLSSADRPLGTGATIQLAGGTLNQLITADQNGNGIDTINVAGTSRVSVGRPVGFNTPRTLSVAPSINLSPGAVFDIQQTHGDTLRLGGVTTLLGAARINGTFGAGGLHLADGENGAIRHGSHVLTLGGFGNTHVGMGLGDAASRLEGSGQMTLDAIGGTLHLAGSNAAFTGGVRMKAGDLVVMGDSTGIPGTPTGGPLGTGPIVVEFGGGILRPAPGVDTVVHNPVSVGHTLRMFTAADTSKLTLTGPVSFTNFGGTIAVEGAGHVTTISGSISGSGLSPTMSKSGAGELVLTGADANDLAGGIWVIDGLLVLAKEGVDQATTGLLQVGSVGQSATVRLDRPQQLGALAAVSINQGRFDLNGYSETAGLFTFNDGAILDFGDGAAIAHFSHLAVAQGSLLIEGWNGSVGGGGIDQLRFNNPLGNDQLAQFHFAGFAPGARQIIRGSFVEVVPIPEPSIWAALFGAGMLCGMRWRRVEATAPGPGRALSQLAVNRSND